ncbi:IS66 family insertion sequence element accessory protein TnpB, partial [Dysosmobacter welbionis]
RLHVGLGEQGGDHRHAVQAAVLQLQNIVMADAADGHHRDVHRRRDGPDGLPGDGLGVRLGAGDESRAHAQVVRPRRLGGQGLFHGVGGNADQLV